VDAEVSMTDDDIERGEQIFRSGKYAPTPGADLLDEVRDWYGRFIAADAEDLDILALWTVHTHLAAECYTTPRLQLDSSMPGSGKTTVCEHLSRLACNATHFASLSSTALLVRILQDGISTLLIDEVDRTLDADKTGVKDLIAVINSGYKIGATRPVLVPAQGGQWRVEKMPTFAPVVLSGNSPHLPDDTRSRCIRILLMPDINDVAEDSDWEEIETDAKALQHRIAVWADSVREAVTTVRVELQPDCTGRAREKWRPLKRIAVVAGGDWPDKCDNLIGRGLAEDEADREDGLQSLPPAVVVMRDLRQVWPNDSPETFLGTKELVNRLVNHNRESWSEFSTYGKRLTETRLGRMITQVAKVHSQRDDRRGPRGYYRVDLERAWKRLGIRENA
jgi:hypothetical protein